MEILAARLREDLHAPLARPVELRREGILVDANLADRGLWRQPATGEAIDKDLSAVGPGGGSGERLLVDSQVRGVVWERFELAASQYQRAGISGRVDVHSSLVG